MARPFPCPGKHLKLPWAHNHYTIERLELPHVSACTLQAMAVAKKESILDLSKYLEKVITVKFTGGREVTGILKGFDALVNLVLDDCSELLRDPDDPYKMTNESRKFGLVVCRGNSVMLLHPADGTEEIANPFLAQPEL